MSIIAGLIDLEGDSPDLGRSVQRMLASLSRYCPDGVEVVHERGASLGVGLLANARPGQKTVGLQRAHGVWAAVDGCLKNGVELSEEFALSCNASSPEIVLEGYRRLGAAIIGRLRGEFAVAIWDGQTRTLSLGRDPFGVRPLYYAQSDEFFLFASDPEVLLASGLISFEADDEVVLDYLLWRPRFPERTFFREIRSTPLRHILRVDGPRREISARVIYQLERVRLNSQEDYWAEYRSRFQKAVLARINSSYPVLATLSGGIDSSSIVCTADRLLRADPSVCPKLTAVSGLYPGMTCDEGPFIRAVSSHVAVSTEVWDGNQGVDELEPSSIALPGGRVSSFSGTDGQFEIAALSGARTILNGDGGDQVGTPWGGIRDAVTEMRWRDALRMTIRRPGADLKSVLGVGSALIRSFIPAQIRNMISAIARSERRPYWLSRWAQKLPRRNVTPPIEPGLDTEIQRRNWGSLSSGWLSMVLAYLQHRAVRASVDIRLPFLDTDVVAVALSVPAKYWPPPWPFERLHREILGPWLPEAVVRRRSKADFSPAVVRRVRRQFPRIAELVHSGQWLSGKYVEQRHAQRLFGECKSSKSGEFSAAYGLWTVATLEAWMRAKMMYASRAPGGDF